MSDPEDLLRKLPDESPPREIVLAAVRLFRYRALAAVAIVVALVVGAVLISQQIGVNGQFPVKVATALVKHGSYEPEGIGQVHDVAGASVVVWNVYGGGSGPDDVTYYIQVAGWDPEGRWLSVEVKNVRQDGEPVVLGEQYQTSQPDGPTSLFDVWFAVTKTPKPGVLTFDAVISVTEGSTSRLLGTAPMQIHV